MKNWGTKETAKERVRGSSIGIVWVAYDLYGVRC